MNAVLEIADMWKINYLTPELLSAFYNLYEVSRADAQFIKMHVLSQIKD